MRARRQLHVTGGALHLSCHIDTSDSSRDGEREHHDLKYAYDNASDENRVRTSVPSRPVLAGPALTR